MSNEIPSLPSFDEVDDVLAAINPDISTAQLHGLITAFICVGKANDDEWLNVILTDLQVSETTGPEQKEMLKQLKQISLRQLQGMNFEFQLLIPDDDYDIIPRAEALGDWCYGFLGGIGLAGITDKETESEDINEILMSFAEIANIDYETAESSEAAEKSFVEISEFVRMGAIYLYQELVALPMMDDAGDSPYLH